MVRTWFSSIQTDFGRVGHQLEGWQSAKLDTKGKSYLNWHVEWTTRASEQPKYLTTKSKIGQGKSQNARIWRRPLWRKQFLRVGLLTQQWLWCHYHEDTGSKESPCMNEWEATMTIWDTIMLLWWRWQTIWEPESFVKAAQDPRWIELMNEEMQALGKNKTWDLVPHSPRNKAIGCKWIYKVKYNVSDAVNQYKVWLIEKGYTHTHSADW